MTKQFYDKVVSDLEAIKERTASSEPITQNQLNEFKKESLEMLEIVNGTKEYKPEKPEVKMTTQKGFKTTKYELKLSAILNRE